MARTPKATPAAQNDAVKTGSETADDAKATTAETIPASEATGGDGNRAVSPQAPSEAATGNSDGGSNDAETAPAATVEGVDQVDTHATEAPEPATVALPDTPEAETDDADPAHQVICLARAVGGPRRRAGLAFDENLRPLTRADLGGTDEKIEETLEILLGDPRLSLLSSTD